jgi:hypothetical protein
MPRKKWREVSVLRSLHQWCRRPDLNWGPTDYESVALPLSYAGKITDTFGILTSSINPFHPRLLYQNAFGSNRGVGNLLKFLNFLFLTFDPWMLRSQIKPLVIN